MPCTKRDILATSIRTPSTAPNGAEIMPCHRPDDHREAFVTKSIRILT
jgi:hypothetical protein